MMCGLERLPVAGEDILSYSDRLHGLKAVASGHRMTGLARQTVPVPTRTQREPATYRGNSRFLPRCRAVARSRRPHRDRCHRRVTDRPCSSPPPVCWGPASHRFRSSFSYVGPRQKPSVGHPVWPQYGGFLRRSVRSTPACSLLGSHGVSEHSSLTGRRGYALVALSPIPVGRSPESVSRGALVGN
jgi:hypothetical protein